MKKQTLTLKLNLKKQSISDLNALRGGGKNITDIDSEWEICSDPNPYRTILENGTCAFGCNTAQFTVNGVTC
ncbi:hypothetical protein KORDIASMS9_01636 [Kordia sp. SMS9]|uniref:hypothetical protein n=1 Tax=Kordia sp. SMS9 TaxID=2282170 RepID=UPI000E0CDF23|nr:hypothetical protein [Kordia sp. SMS9]AXG69414.1 hypothetical protein KORDIASMS9_01636 [Kordia sp. SMS9]